jgi:hypothetical protein
VRDDFSRQTVMDIARGVGYRCSNPECTRPTVGANAAQDGIVTIGVAAHIYAASPGGPRYNAAQTREARRARENGIWLCQNCGRLVDADAQKFTIDVLTDWKRVAQARAFRELVAPEALTLGEEAARVGSIIEADNANQADADFNSLFEKVHAAGSADLSAHMRAPIWSGSSVELTLRVCDDPTVPPFSISKLPMAVEIAPQRSSSSRSPERVRQRHSCNLQRICSLPNPLFRYIFAWATGPEALRACSRAYVNVPLSET